MGCIGFFFQFHFEQHLAIGFLTALSTQLRLVLLATTSNPPTLTPYLELMLSSVSQLKKVHRQFKTFFLMLLPATVVLYCFRLSAVTDMLYYYCRRLATYFHTMSIFYQAATPHAPYNTTGINQAATLHAPYKATGINQAATLHGPYNTTGMNQSCYPR